MKGETNEKQINEREIPDVVFIKVSLKWGKRGKGEVVGRGMWGWWVAGWNSGEVWKRGGEWRRWTGDQTKERGRVKDKQWGGGLRETMVHNTSLLELLRYRSNTHQHSVILAPEQRRNDITADVDVTLMTTQYVKAANAHMVTFTFTMERGLTLCVYCISHKALHT